MYRKVIICVVSVLMGVLFVGIGYTAGVAESRITTQIVIDREAVEAVTAKLDQKFEEVITKMMPHFDQQVEAFNQAMAQTQLIRAVVGVVGIIGIITFFFIALMKIRKSQQATFPQGEKY